jgi:hypothetical protein
MLVQTIPLKAGPAVLGPASPLKASALGAKRLGQWGDIVSSLINAGIQVYTTEQQQEMAEDREDFAREQADKAAAREAEALRIQKEMVTATQAKAVADAKPGEPIFGMPPIAFYSVLGVGGGALLLGLMYMMKSK